jgi:hypothetical protein
VAAAEEAEEKAEAVLGVRGGAARAVVKMLQENERPKRRMENKRKEE